MRTAALVFLIPIIGCAEATPAPVSIEASPAAVGASAAPVSSAAVAPPAESAPAVKPGASAAASKPASAAARVHLADAQATGLAETTRLVASLRPAFVTCFDEALKNDAGLSGKLVVHVKIDPTGKVAGVKLDDEIGLDITLAGCLVTAVRAASFPPAPSGATLAVPLEVTP